MKALQGRGVVSGQARGKALVTRMPINFTAALSRLGNLFPGQRAVVQDRHHELYKKNMKGTVLVFPAGIGSTFTGMVLMQLMDDGHAPAAMITQHADSLLTSGAILAEVWFQRGIPVIEYPGDDLFDKIADGAQVEVNGETGEIKVY